MNFSKILSTVLALLASVILVQTLYFKFTGHPQSMEIFSKLGVEPWGRIGVGIIELVVGIMLILPKTRFFGAIMGIGLMIGAIGSHLITIGIESNMDGGLLFILAIVVLVACLILSFLHKEVGLALLKKITRK